MLFLCFLLKYPFSGEIIFLDNLKPLRVHLLLYRNFDSQFFRSLNCQQRQKSFRLKCHPLQESGASYRLWKLKQYEFCYF